MKKPTVEVPTELIARLMDIDNRATPRTTREHAFTLCYEFKQVVFDLKTDPNVFNPLDECGKAYARNFSYNNDSMFPDHTYWNKPALLAALKRYRELGCPELPEPSE